MGTGYTFINIQTVNLDSYMTRPCNLFFLAKSFSSPIEIEAVSDFALLNAIQTNRNQVQSAKQKEIESLITFVDDCVAHGASIQALEGFVFNYVIPQIGQEFDALKICHECVIDIELKSLQLDKEKARKQLIMKRHYLKGVSEEDIYLFTYCSSSQSLYRLSSEDAFEETDWTSFLEILLRAKTLKTDDYDSLFHPSHYLVPPINDPEDFQNRSYFLTNHQTKIKNQIMRFFDSEQSGGFILSGGPGTGKSLLLYDIARQLSEKHNLESCVVHCGVWTTVHARFNSVCPSIQLFHVKESHLIDCSNYAFIGIDETQRIYPNDLQKLLEQINASDKPFLVCIDQNQTMTTMEGSRNIYDEVTRIIPSERTLTLNGRFRFNHSLSSFIKKLFDCHQQGTLSKDCVSFVHARTIDEVRIALTYYCSLGYQHISISTPLYSSSYLDEIQFRELGSINTHQAIGQEFDRVVMVVPRSFAYDCTGKLVAEQHPNPDYLLEKLLYQGVTRAREKLAIVFYNNPVVFHTVLSFFS